MKYDLMEGKAVAIHSPFGMITETKMVQNTMVIIVKWLCSLLSKAPWNVLASTKPARVLRCITTQNILIGRVYFLNAIGKQSYY